MIRWNVYNRHGIIGQVIADTRDEALQIADSLYMDMRRVEKGLAISVNISCSWCYRVNASTVAHCPNCGHEVGKLRVACACNTCTGPQGRFLNDLRNRPEPTNTPASEDLWPDDGKTPVERDKP